MKFILNLITRAIKVISNVCTQMTESFIHYSSFIFFINFIIYFYEKLGKGLSAIWGLSQRGNNNQFPTESEAPAYRGDLLEFLRFSELRD